MPMLLHTMITFGLLEENIKMNLWLTNIHWRFLILTVWEMKIVNIGAWVLKYWLQFMIHAQWSTEMNFMSLEEDISWCQYPVCSYIKPKTLQRGGNFCPLNNCCYLINLTNHRSHPIDIKIMFDLRSRIWSSICQQPSDKTQFLDTRLGEPTCACNIKIWPWMCSVGG